MVFFDASAAVKAYVDEQGSSTIRAAIARLRGDLLLSPLVVVEVLGTLAKQRRAGVLTNRDYLDSRARFLSELPEFFNTIALPEEVFDEASDLVHRHRMVSVGSSDLVHVAFALRLQNTARNRPLTLASSDRGLLAVARVSGLNTFDPEIEPLAVLLASR